MNITGTYTFYKDGVPIHKQQNIITKFGKRFLTNYLTYYPAWIIILPFRLLPIIFDKIIEFIFKWPGYSICMIAKKNK